VESLQSVTNVRPASGGADEESLDAAKLRAAQELKNKDRAVTADDFESLSIGTPGTRVRRAKALPLRHPSFGPVRIPGVVTVIVVPESDSPRPNRKSTRLNSSHGSNSYAVFCLKKKKN